MGDAPFLLDADGSVALSYAERAVAADGLAAALARQGLREGDVVATALPAGPMFAVAVLACWRLGVVLAPVSPRLAPGERQRAIAVVRPRALLAQEAVPGVPLLGLVPAGGRTGADVAWTGAADGRRPEPSEPSVRPGDALLLLTSGSTGVPKAVILT